MSISVFFRGPILFVTRGNTLKDCRIPNGNLKDSTHFDGDKAVQHYPCLFVVDKAGNEERIDVLTETVSLVDSLEGDDCLVTPSLVTVSLPSVLNGSDPARQVKLVRRDVLMQSKRAAAFVDIKGGKLSGGYVAQPFEWHCLTPFVTPPAPQRLSVMPEWKPSGSTCRLLAKGTLDGASKEIDRELKDGDRVYICNFDEAKPTKDTVLTSDNPCEKAGAKVLPDYDFRWLYKLLDPVGISWQEFLLGCRLPFPAAFCPGSAGATAPRPIGDAREPKEGEPPAGTGDVSTCYPGGWPC